MYCTYILYSESTERYYIGSTGNLEDRLLRHNQGRSKATKAGLPWRLLYTKDFYTRSEAYQFELYIKRQKSRAFIQQLIDKSYSAGSEHSE